MANLNIDVDIIYYYNAVSIINIIVAKPFTR